MGSPFDKLRVSGLLRPPVVSFLPLMVSLSNQERP